MLAKAYFQINHNDRTPRYLQIQENLIELIDLGLLNAGDSLPSERDLSRFYQVNRMTVRQAIDGLVSQGLIYKQHGIGNFVSDQPPVKQFAPTVMGFSQRMREAGLIPSSRLLKQDVIIPSPLICYRLRLEQDSPVIIVKRLRLVNDEPLMLETSYLPYARYKRVMNYEVDSLYQILEDEYGIIVSDTEQTLEPTLLEEAEARHFGLPVGKPAMLVRILAYTEDRQPIEFSKSVVRGDRCRYYFRVNTQKPIVL